MAKKLKKLSKKVKNDLIESIKRRIDAIDNYWLKELEDKLTHRLKQFVYYELSPTLSGSEEIFLYHFNHLKEKVERYQLEKKELREDLEKLKED